MEYAGKFLFFIGLSGFIFANFLRILGVGAVADPAYYQMVCVGHIAMMVGGLGLVYLANLRPRN